MSPMWMFTISGLHPLKEAYRRGELTFEASRDAQVAILRDSPVNRVSDDFATIVDELGETVDEDDFDDVLAELYDVCDRDRVWLDPVS